MKLYCNYLCMILLSSLCYLNTADAEDSVINKMEQALMPGELSAAHAKFETDCTNCHKFFSKSFQNDLCLDCHDHKNIKQDIKSKKGYHGRIPNIDNRLCKTCHREHIGRNASITFFDKQTFDHNATDFKLRDSHLGVLCSKCHAPNKKHSEAPQKCYDCHKKQDPHNGKLGRQCNSCHIEITWQDFKFDHSQTKFKLNGRHKGVLCRDCHPRERYQGTPQTCYACHGNNDVHQGKFGKKCKSCHSVNGWINQQFNHDKDTKFKLTEKHKLVTCQQCHKKDPYKNKTPKDCYSCHKFEDEHKGLFGKKCQDCHSTKAWQKQSFDHSKTDFSLLGKHKEVTCKECHPNRLDEKVSVKCFDCHKHQDPHEGQQGKKCNDCHNPADWIAKVQFDHNITRFPLLGGHATLSCEECHASSNFKDAKIKCDACHKQDDYHKQSLGNQCQMCHISNDWKIWNFDHNKQTKFDLEGAHKGIVCDACHNKPVKDKIKLPKQCYNCHSKDDIHDGSYGRNCERCHNVKNFTELNL